MYDLLRWEIKREFILAAREQQGSAVKGKSVRSTAEQTWHWSRRWVVNKLLKELLLEETFQKE